MNNSMERIINSQRKEGPTVAQLNTASSIESLDLENVDSDDASPDPTKHSIRQSSQGTEPDYTTPMAAQKTRHSIATAAASVKRNSLLPKKSSPLKEIKRKTLDHSELDVESMLTLKNLANSQPANSAKAMFIKRLPDQMAQFKRNRARNREYIAIIQNEEKHWKGVFKHSFNNHRMMNDGRRD